jgi:hypothetical protein
MGVKGCRLRGVGPSFGQLFVCCGVGAVAGTSRISPWGFYQISTSADMQGIPRACVCELCKPLAHHLFFDWCLACDAGIYAAVKPRILPPPFAVL